MSNLPYAEDINYWKTSQKHADTWIDKAEDLIVKFGGRILGRASGTDEQGRSAFMLAFEINGDRFKIIWPVLPTKGNAKSAARTQAATMLYHDVKAKCISATVLGARTAFFSYLILPDGRTAAQLATPELTSAIPALLLSNGERE